MTQQLQLLFEDVQIQIDAAKKSTNNGFYATADAELNGALMMLQDLQNALDVLIGNRK